MAGRADEALVEEQMDDCLASLCHALVVLEHLSDRYEHAGKAGRAVRRIAEQLAADAGTERFDLVCPFGGRHTVMLPERRSVRLP